ncbi:hypothetical protein [Sorangium sp. So ce1000]|uniref:hypothetical protein n=1 Tax=Sorangium sp. So ce1000 TaxID=3133325 RepID=UPI003F5F1FBC
MKDTLSFHLKEHWDYLFPSFERGIFGMNERLALVADLLATAWPDIQNAVTILGLANQGCDTTIRMSEVSIPKVRGGLQSDRFGRGQNLIFHAINQMLTDVTPSTLPKTSDKHYTNHTINVINPYLLETSGDKVAPVLRTSKSHVNVFQIVAAASYGVKYKDVYFDTSTNKIKVARGDGSGLHNFLIGNPIRALTWFYNYIVSGFEDPKIRIVEVPSDVAAEVVKRLKPQNNEYTGMRVCDSQNYNSIEFTIDKHTHREQLVYERFLDAFQNLRTVSRTAPKGTPDPRDGACFTVADYLSALGIRSADGYFGMMGGLISSPKMPQSLKDSSTRFEKYSKALDLLETQERRKSPSRGTFQEALIIKTFLDELIWHSAPIVYRLLKILHKSSQSVVLLHKNNLKDGYDALLERRSTDNFVLYSVFDYPWYDDVHEIFEMIASEQYLSSRGFLNKPMRDHSADSKAGQSVRYFKGFMGMPTDFAMDRPTWGNTFRYYGSYLSSSVGGLEKWVWRDDITLLELFNYVRATVKMLKEARSKQRNPRSNDGPQQKKHMLETLRTLGLVHTLFRPLHDALTESDRKQIEEVPLHLKPHADFTGSVTRESEVYPFQLLQDETVPFGPYTASHKDALNLPKLLVYQDKYASVGKHKPKNDKYSKLIKQHDLFMGGLSGTTRDELVAVLGLAPIQEEARRWGFLLSYMGFAYIFKFHSVTEVFHQAANYLIPIEAEAKGRTLHAITNLQDPKNYAGTRIGDVIEVFESELPRFKRGDISTSWALKFLLRNQVEVPRHYKD